MIKYCESLIQAGRFCDAVLAADAIIHNGIYVGEALLLRSVALCRQGFYEESLEDLDLAIALDGESALLLLNKAAVLGNMDKLSEAVSLIERAASLDEAIVFLWFKTQPILPK